MAQVDHTIAISNTVKNYIIDTYNVSESKITTIPRGCDSNTFNRESAPDAWIDKWYKEFPQTTNKIILTLPTRISKWKGVDSFIELLAKLDGKKFHGLIVGPASNSKKRYLESLKKKVTKLGINKNITFTGSRNDIKNIYKIFCSRLLLRS